MSGDIVKCGRCGAGNVATRAVCYQCDSALEGAAPWPQELTAAGGDPQAPAFWPVLADKAAGREFECADFMQRALGLFFDELLLAIAGLTPLRHVDLDFGWARIDWMQSWNVFGWLKWPYALAAVVLAHWLYYAGYESLRGGTLGKLLFHCEVVGLNGKRISFWRATGRFVLKVMTVMWLVFALWMLWGAIENESRWQLVGLFSLPVLVSVVMVAWTRNMQALHDWFAGTVVVQTPPEAATD